LTIVLLMATLDLKKRKRFEDIKLKKRSEMLINLKYDKTLFHF